MKQKEPKKHSIESHFNSTELKAKKMRKIYNENHVIQLREEKGEQ